MTRPRAASAGQRRLSEDLWQIYGADPSQSCQRPGPGWAVKTGLAQANAVNCDQPSTIDRGVWRSGEAQFICSRLAVQIFKVNMETLRRVSL